MKDNDFVSAIKGAVKHIGSEVKLAERSGINQPDINRIKNGKTPINNVTIGTFRKIFPDMQIDFFGTGKQRGHIAKIIKMLNRLTDEEQLQIMLDIVANYSAARDEKSKNFTTKEKHPPIKYEVEEVPLKLHDVAEDHKEYNKDEE